MYTYVFVFFFYKQSFDLSVWYRDSTEIEFRWVSPPCLSRVAENITQWYIFNKYLSVCVSTNQLHKSVFLFHCHFVCFYLLLKLHGINKLKQSKLNINLLYRLNGSDIFFFHCHVWFLTVLNLPEIVFINSVTIKTVYTVWLYDKWLTFCLAIRNDIFRF